MSRPLRQAEKYLLQWMLENSTPEAKEFIPQAETISVEDWRCPCGCASINFSGEGLSNPVGEIQVLADFIFGTDDNLNGIFVFQKNGVLGGIEVYGFAGDAPRCLPSPESLRPFSNAANPAT